MQTTPEFQKAAAEAARKDGEQNGVESNVPPPNAVPEPMAGSKSSLQTPANLNENKITKLP
jgi:hypothetical protein